MKLYEITQEFKTLEDLYMEAIDEETGEIKNSEILAQFEKEVVSSLQNKAGNIIKFIRNDESLEVAVDNEIKRLQMLKKSIKTKKENIKNYVVYAMSQMKVKKIETEVGTLSLRASKSVEIYDEMMIDKKFTTEVVEIKISKTELKKAIEAGEDVQGARIVSKNSLQIK